jgi:hypothetical protein
MDQEEVDMQYEEARRDYEGFNRGLQPNSFLIQFPNSSALFRIEIPPDYPRGPPWIWKDNARIDLFITTHWIPHFRLIHVLRSLTQYTDWEHPPEIFANPDELRRKITQADLSQLQTDRGLRNFVRALPGADYLPADGEQIHAPNPHHGYIQSTAEVADLQKRKNDLDQKIAEIRNREPKLCQAERHKRLSSLNEEVVRERAIMADAIRRFEQGPATAAEGPRFFVDHAQTIFKSDRKVKALEALIDHINASPV